MLEIVGAVSEQRVLLFVAGFAAASAVMCWRGDWGNIAVFGWFVRGVVAELFRSGGEFRSGVVPERSIILRGYSRVTAGLFRSGVFTLRRISLGIHARDDNQFSSSKESSEKIVNERFFPCFLSMQS